MTSLYESVETLTARRLMFYLRSLVSQQHLDPRIKIFSYDDRTAAALGELDLTLSSWAKVITAIDARQPSGVFIDKLFDRKYSAEEVESFAESARTWRSPVFPIVFLHRDEIAFRTPIDLTLKQKFSDTRFFAEGDRFTSLPAFGAVYGASPRLLNSFTAAGHTIYNGDGKGRLFYLSASGAVVPHQGLLASETINPATGGANINGRFVATDPMGEFVVNFFPRKQYVSRSLSMLELVRVAELGKPVTPIQAGDYVVILPAMYTGNTDWRETPFGSMPGGYYMVSVLNSVLTSRWIRMVSDPGFGVILLTAFLIVVGRYLNSVALIASTLSLLVSVVAGFIALFVYADILVSWVAPASGTLFSLLCLLIGKGQDSRLEQSRLDSELATAKLVQSSIFPPSYLEAGDIRLAGFYETSSECGGDWWHQTSVSEQENLFLIGDAVGHGVPAAMVATLAFAVNSACEQFKLKKETPVPDPAEFLEILNGVLWSMKSPSAVMTFQIARIDTVAMTMVLANAGHVLPIIVPRSPDDPRLKEKKRSIVIRNAGNPIGLGVKCLVGTKTTDLAAGDRLVFYTDGIIENVGGDKMVPLNRKGLVEIVEESWHESVEVMRDNIVARYTKHVGTSPRADDATLVVLGIR